MPVPKKITPTGLISSIILLSTFLGVAFGVKETFMTKAEAAEVIAVQQARAVESDLQMVNLEIQFLEEKLLTRKKEKIANDEVVLEIEKRLKFLYDKRLILEKYQLELNN